MKAAVAHRVYTNWRERVTASETCWGDLRVNAARVSAGVQDGGQAVSDIEETGQGGGVDLLGQRAIMVVCRVLH